ncbi:ABC transporter permease [Aquibacillus albus]|uniref:ABC-type dipeptide/oligopeptide/nickel transport system permease subunit n=1 Tax=Aquibacillus albus TaxID=1168171 RepID=A0ABS2N4J0_9BACI|nr:ABC transporter permease [Aquibacillus albus]MBM7573042.1 ABC-type dipeptide/oligopeptide/nickel transport system permease subunit [Aquibacillus albus]
METGTAKVIDKKVYTSPAAAVPPKRSSVKRFLKVFLARKVVVFSLFVLLSLVFVAIFAPLVAPYDPYYQDLTKSLQKPSMEHLLGTDMLGRDVLSRIIYGSRVSIAVGIVSVIIAGGIGMILGLIAGYFGGFIDSIIMRFMDAMMAIPMIILALFIGSALGGGLDSVMISLGIALVPSYARLTRGQVLSVKESDYVLAGTISGTSNFKNMFVHVLPNSLSPIIVLVTMNLGIAILAEAALSFLGMGINPPGAAWGAMVNEGYKYLMSQPVLSIAPGIAIIIVVLSFNIVGDALRDALDPRLRGRI